LLLIYCSAGWGLEPVSGGLGALLFSQCNVVWRGLIQARDSGCQSFGSSWCFFPAKCGSSILARFFIYRAHTVCFCTLVSILDSQKISSDFLSSYLISTSKTFVTALLIFFFFWNPV
jgi:hypothetical protein